MGTSLPAGPHDRDGPGFRQSTGRSACARPPTHRRRRARRTCHGQGVAIKDTDHAGVNRPRDGVGPHGAPLPSSAVPRRWLIAFWKKGGVSLPRRPKSRSTNFLRASVTGWPSVMQAQSPPTRGQRRWPHDVKHGFPRSERWGLAWRHSYRGRGIYPEGKDRVRPRLKPPGRARQRSRNCARR